MSKDYRLEVTPPSTQRRRELAMDDAWIKAFLQRARIGHVATVWDDQPFITPSTFWYDPQQHQIFFHSNVTGRVRANSERASKVCFESSEAGDLLPSNVALEFSIQYESVVAFGEIHVLEAAEEKLHALNGLLAKYFPQYSVGKHYRPITGNELQRTSVYAIHIENWSGKRNWPEQAEQSPDWPTLPLESL